MKALRVTYEGRVQGVGFRYTARHLAKGFEVGGSVCNLPEGGVQIEVAGPESREFLQAIRESALAGHIASERVEEIDLPESPRGFCIIP